MQLIIVFPLLALLHPLTGTFFPIIIFTHKKWVEMDSKFSLEEPGWIMRNCEFPWLLDLQSQQRVWVYACIKPDWSKRGTVSAWYLCTSERGRGSRKEFIRHQNVLHKLFQLNILSKTTITMHRLCIFLFYYALLLYLAVNQI